MCSQPSAHRLSGAALGRRNNAAATCSGVASLFCCRTGGRILPCRDRFIGFVFSRSDTFTPNYDTRCLAAPLQACVAHRGSVRRADASALQGPGGKVVLFPFPLYVPSNPDREATLPVLRYCGDGHRRRIRIGAFDFHGVPDFERLVARRITRLTRPNRLAGRDKSRPLRDQPQRIPI